MSNNRRRYNPAVRTAGGNRARLRQQVGGGGAVDDLALTQRVAESAALLACADNRHHTETDAVTGDEVCRACGTVVEP